jgi:Flp pilus assembly pilin Flp
MFKSLVAKTRTFSARLARDESGVSAIEFGLVVPMIAGSLLGLVELGTVVFERTDMHGAVRAGAQYIMDGGTDLNQARTVVLTSWTTKPEGAVVNVSKFCLCDEVVHACNTPCSDMSVPEAYTRVEALAVLGGVVYSYGTSADDTVRIR